MQLHAHCQESLTFVAECHLDLHHCFTVAFSTDYGSMVQEDSQRNVSVIPMETFCHELSCRQCDENFGLQGAENAYILPHIFLSFRVSWYTHILSHLS